MTMIESDIPGVMHQIADGGLTFISIYQNSNGSMKSTVGWATLEDAQAHYEEARILFEKRIPELDKQLRELEAGKTTNSSLKTYFNKRIAVYINTGPPTWWLPRLGLAWKPTDDGLVRVRAGWLRGCVSVHLLQKKSG